MRQITSRTPVSRFARAARGYALVAAGALAVAACGTPPPVRSIACNAAVPPQITFSPDGTTATTQIRVLTYNIEGLGWPARTDRAADLHKIGENLDRLRESGQGPDVVMFQEMFSGPAKQAVSASGYPAVITGPRRTSPSVVGTTERMPGHAHLKRGELGIHLTGGGLAIVSRYAIVQTQESAYGRRSCAGMDCLANKGIVMARIAIPGVPTPVDFYDTHMNSRAASRATVDRSVVAHERQSLEASKFIDKTHDDAFPVIFGGDFNMRHSEIRWANFTRYQSLALVHRVCANPANGCDVRMTWKGDKPWMNTQDLQLFWHGSAVSVRPIRVEAVFDGGPSGPVMSDHNGFMVTYELSWPAALTTHGCGAPPPQVTQR